MLLNTPSKKLLGGYEFTVIDPDAVMASVELNRADETIPLGAGFYLIEHRGTGLCAVGRTAQLRRSIFYAASRGMISKWLKGERKFNPADYYFYVGRRTSTGLRVRPDKSAVGRDLGARLAGKHNAVSSQTSFWELHMLTHRATGFFFISGGIQTGSAFNPMRLVNYFHDYRTRNHLINNVPLRNFVELHPDLNLEDFDVTRLDYGIPSRARCDELKKGHSFSHGTDKCLSMGVGRKHWKLYPIALKQMEERHGVTTNVR